MSRTKGPTPADAAKPSHPAAAILPEAKPATRPAAKPRVTLPKDAPALAKKILRGEAQALVTLADSLGDPFEEACRLIVACAESGGTVLVTGLGKSGLVGAKISATLASLGIPSHAVHPSEAAHGDLGRFRKTDTVVCISASGETTEVVNVASILRQDGLPIISITARTVPQGATKPSSLEALATVALGLNLEHEAGEPDFAAPTSSTTATMALGDALAIVAAKARDFTDADFKRRHPGGTLGDLLRPITEVLRFKLGKDLPRITDDRSVAAALEEAAKWGRRPGAIILCDAKTGRLSGIFTDADLRRLILRDPAELHNPIAAVMTKNPRYLQDSALVRDAVKLVREHRADEIPVVNAAGEPVGVLDVQDLITMRLVQD
ncbi:MAG: KpsF/GutQ family sugar-phosphate isomerase [Phycisphaerales bacterium]|nr:KpsF/GutQ family sugar-phosphate isomerase [Phycisphaerales bacterium]